MIRDIALLGARLAVGAAIAGHGAQKALGWYDGMGADKAAKMVHGLGFCLGSTYGPLAAWNEIVSGGLIVAGLGGPIGPSLVITEMIIAAVAVKWKNGFFERNNGIELAFLYGAAALGLAAGDFGAISMDAAIGTRGPLRNPYFTALTLAAGIAGATLLLNSRDQSLEGPATPTFRGKNSPLPEEQAAPN